jgi:hypothetical protein
MCVIYQAKSEMTIPYTQASGKMLQTNRSIEKISLAKHDFVCDAIYIRTFLGKIIMNQISKFDLHLDMRPKWIANNVQYSECTIK